MRTFARQLASLALISACFLASNAQGRPEFLEEWRESYPDSKSGDRQCQVCHANENGFEPWNTYGFEIRSNFIELYSSSDIKAAIASVENNNSDNDPRSLSNLEEIQQGLDPGWTSGPTNSLIFKNGDAFLNQLPPSFDRPVDTLLESSLCFPVTSTNIKIVLICL